MERITTIEKWKKVNENENRGTIYFRNFTQKCLFDLELKGQLSDGFWENSPSSNWEFWCRLNTSVDETNPRVEGARTSGKIGFNLANPQLLDVVGDRMLSMAKMSKVTTDEKVVKAAEYLECINTEEELFKVLKNASEYMQKQFNQILDRDFQEYVKVNYSKSNMIADLKDMAAIMKTVNGAPLISKAPKALVFSTTPKVSTSVRNMDYEDKDVVRIEGIVAKAKGDRDKENQLATNMANSITDGAKALRRGRAAEEQNFHNIAKIFFDRAKTLGTAI